VTTEDPSSVGLIAVDEVVLEQLVHVAVSDASADEVTPPLSAGPEWTPARIAWLETFHRDRRAGFSGAAAEATWAVVVGNAVVGSVRLKSTNEQGVLETGIWLTRSSRGRGVAVAAMAAVLREAAALDAQEVRADTTTGNASALGVLRRLGFDFEVTDGDSVRARLLFGQDVRLRADLPVGGLSRDPSEDVSHLAGSQPVREVIAGHLDDIRRPGSEQRTQITPHLAVGTGDERGGN
jgi:RimJ/RimL family protein N-acetyltransferase